MRPNLQAPTPQRPAPPPGRNTAERAQPKSATSGGADPVRRRQPVARATATSDLGIPAMVPDFAPASPDYFLVWPLGGPVRHPRTRSPSAKDPRDPRCKKQVPCTTNLYFVEIRTWILHGLCTGFAPALPRILFSSGPASDTSVPVSDMDIEVHYIRVTGVIRRLLRGAELGHHRMCKSFRIFDRIFNRAGAFIVLPPYYWPPLPLRRKGG